MKRKLLFAMLCIIGALGMRAQITWESKTGLIVNPSFETDDAIADLTTCGWATDRVTGWTITPASSSNAQIGVGNSSSKTQGIGPSFAPSDGEKYFYTRNNWNATTTYKISQTIAANGNLPAGLYKLTCKAATYSSTATLGTIELSLQEGSKSAIARTGIVLDVWNNWGVIILKESDDTDLTLAATMVPGGADSGRHYAMLLDDFQLEYISMDDAYAASESNAIDFSGIINNANIYNKSNTNMPRGWTAYASTRGNSNYTEGTGDTQLEGWSGGNLNIDYYQTISNLPAGSYSVTAKVHSTSNVGNVYAYTTTAEKALSETMSSEYQDLTTSVLKVSNGSMNIGIQASTSTGSWVTGDNFRISFLGFDIDAVKANLEAALAAAKEAISNNPNITGSEKVALEATIAAYTTTETQSYAWYAAATQAVESATSAFTAAKADYDIFAEYNKELKYADAAKKPAITDETKAADLLPALRAYYESHAKAEAVEGAVDVTSAINNPDAMDSNNGWTWTGSKNNPKNNEPWTDANGNASHWYFDGGNWGGNSWTTTMEQTVTIPAGKYLLTAKARSAENVTFTMTVGEESVELPHVGSAGNVFNRGWGDASVEFETAGEPATIKVSASTGSQYQWFSIADFRLVRLELNSSLYADADDYAALNTAIAAAEGKTLGFEADEFAPYENAAALQAIEAAKAIDQTAELTNLKADVQALTTALGEWKANTAEVNAVFDGNFALQPAHESGENVVLPGWTTEAGNTRLILKDTETYKALTDAEAQAALFVHPGTYTYGNPAGYTMPLKANTRYAVSAKYCSWQNNSNNDFTLTVKKDGETVATKSFGKVSQALTEEGALKAVKYVFETTEAGDYTLTVGANGNTAFTDVKIVKATSADAEPASVVFGSAEDITVGQTGTNAPTVSPEGLTLTYSSENESVATVDATTGEVTGVHVGNATITATWEEQLVGLTLVAAGSASYNVYIAAAPVSLEGFYRIKNNGNDKYVEVRGRKTAVPDQTLDAAYTEAGTIIKLTVDEGKVTELRSQGVDIPDYVTRLMKYMPEVVDLAVDKLGLGELFGSTGVDLILDKFNSSADLNLHVEEVEGGYRIYGKTPSMKPVVEFYAENQAKVDAKLPLLEQAVNDAIKKLVDKLGTGASFENTFALHLVWERMSAAGRTLTEPVDNDTKLQFLQEVLVNEDYVWQFAYQTATYYMDFLEGKQKFQDVLSQSEELQKYWNKLKYVQPDSKYYIVQKDGKLDIFNQKNVAIENNEANTRFALEPINDANYFGVDFKAATETTTDEGTFYYTTLYTDFGYTLPTGVKAYIVSEINDKGYAITEEVSGQVPAQTPVLLESETSGVVAFTELNSNESALTSNLLRGNDYLINTLDIQNPTAEALFATVKSFVGETLYDRYIAKYEYLMKRNAGTVNNKFFFDLTESELASHDEVSVDGYVHALSKKKVNGEQALGFFKYRKTLSGNKAFLYIDKASAGVRAEGVLLNGNHNATAIQGVEEAGNEAAATYDLNGRKVSRPFKGVFIVNGKKVVLK